ncbi:MFS general substrate transporter [Russula earlei]|uniref:MFS general substrate transporter n=1 Tax=Russula earlei TaxID=71964 RepID=A0ACC0U0R8_9AGAM|nr:MFS general substrate transporter [Russula earlei]
MTPPSTNDNGARSQLGREDEGYEEGKVELEDSPPSPLCLYRPDVDISAVDPRKLKRKIDFRLVPWLTLLYLMNFLDRGSIGNARLYNMEKDLHTTDEQFLLALTVFFFPFALFEVPSNLVLRHLRPSRWLSFIVFAWGIVSYDLTCLAIPERIDGSTGLRCLLGLAEAGLFPGIVFYLSCWYKSSELGSRIALFFTAATMGGAFSGSLAVAIRNMDGLGGRPRWAWIFIIEGLVTILMACISPLVGILMGFAGAAFPIASFTPTIINELGLSATAANLLSVPVYALGGFFGMAFLAYVILIVSRSVALSYFAVYLAASAWISSNVEGSYKRATALAMAIAFGNMNGAVISNVYRERDRPRYRLGHGTVLAYIAVCWLSSLVLYRPLRRENKARDRGELDEVIDDVENKNADPDNGRYGSVADARREKGDRWSGFRYTV